MQKNLIIKPTFLKLGLWSLWVWGYIPFITNNILLEKERKVLPNLSMNSQVT